MHEKKADMINLGTHSAIRNIFPHSVNIERFKKLEEGRERVQSEVNLDNNITRILLNLHEEVIKISKRNNEYYQTLSYVGLTKTKSK